MSKIWTVVEGNYVKVGFERSFLNQMDQCWHIMPAQARGVLRAKHPLLVVETNDEVISIPSPVEGTVHHFNDKARNFPDKITETDTIITINTKVTKAAAEKTVSERPQQRAQAVPIPPPAAAPAPQRFFVNDWPANPAAQPMPGAVGDQVAPRPVNQGEIAGNRANFQAIIDRLNQQQMARGNDANDTEVPF